VGVKDVFFNGLVEKGLDRLKCLEAWFGTKNPDSLAQFLSKGNIAKVMGAGLAK